jgi:hypothetical protein
LSRPSDDFVRVGDRVAWLDVTDQALEAVYATTLPDGPPVVLRATAALIFLEAVEGGRVDEVVERVAEESGQPVEHIRDDVVRFLDDLVHRGLLSRTG